MKMLRTLTAAIAISFMSVSASAATILFTESFESPVTTNPDPLDKPTGWTFSGQANLNGVYNTPATTPYGDQVYRGYTGGAGFIIQTTSSILSDTVIAGAEYTLTLNYGSHRADRAGNFTVRLLAIDGSNNVTELASDSRSWVSGHGFGEVTEELSLSVTPAANAGERVAIEIRQQTITTGYANFDNISLEVVPEPSSLALLGLGGLLVARRRRA